MLLAATRRSRFIRCSLEPSLCRTGPPPVLCGLWTYLRGFAHDEGDVLMQLWRAVGLDGLLASGYLLSRRVVSVVMSLFRVMLDLQTEMRAIFLRHLSGVVNPRVPRQNRVC